MRDLHRHQDEFGPAIGTWNGVDSARAWSRRDCDCELRIATLMDADQASLKSAVPCAFVGTHFRGGGPSKAAYLITHKVQIRLHPLRLVVCKLLILCGLDPRNPEPKSHHGYTEGYRSTPTRSKLRDLLPGK